MPKDRPIFDVQSLEQAGGGDGIFVQYAPLFTVTVIGGLQPVGCTIDGELCVDG